MYEKSLTIINKFFEDKEIQKYTSFSVGMYAGTFTLKVDCFGSELVAIWGVEDNTVNVQFCERESILDEYVTTSKIDIQLDDLYNYIIEHADLT